jgi:hypothetical protein
MEIEIHLIWYLMSSVGRGSNLGFNRKVVLLLLFGNILPTFTLKMSFLVSECWMLIRILKCISCSVSSFPFDFSDCQGILRCETTIN